MNSDQLVVNSLYYNYDMYYTYCIILAWKLSQVVFCTVS